MQIGATSSHWLLDPILALRVSWRDQGLNRWKKSIPAVCQACRGVSINIQLLHSQQVTEAFTRSAITSPTAVQRRQAPRAAGPTPPSRLHAHSTPRFQAAASSLATWRRLHPSAGLPHLCFGMLQATIMKKQPERALISKLSQTQNSYGAVAAFDPWPGETFFSKWQPRLLTWALESHFDDTGHSLGSWHNLAKPILPMSGCIQAMRLVSLKPCFCLGKGQGHTEGTSNHRLHRHPWNGSHHGRTHKSIQTVRRDAVWCWSQRWCSHRHFSLAQYHIAPRSLLVHPGRMQDGATADNLVMDAAGHHENAFFGKRQQSWLCSEYLKIEACGALGAVDNAKGRMHAERGSMVIWGILETTTAQTKRQRFWNNTHTQRSNHWIIAATGDKGSQQGLRVITKN